MNGGMIMKTATDITIFGGTGDLTFRKLLPALYTMYRTGKLPEGSQLTIIGRRDYTSDSYRAKAREWVKKFTRLPYAEDLFEEFSHKIRYYQMDFTDLKEYQGLGKFYETLKQESHIFYFAVAPRFFGNITTGLKSIPGLKPGKVMIEKPFGETLTSAKALNQELMDFFGADNIYRIDHYLGKEMIRNIQTIRFANPIFSNVWNFKAVESVEISALEDVGVETRGGYYDASGALKDMVQNHLFQILSILAMEQPESFTSEAMHQEQIRVLKSLKPVSAAELHDTLVLGQYDGYTKEPLVAPDSHTETYACLRLFIENERWRGTPFYIRTGKRTGVRQTEIAVTFRRAYPGVEPDILIIKIQPTEGIYLQFNIKRPGDTDEIIKTSMDFCQNCILENQVNTPEAYERLLTACLRGERSWFSHWDQIEISWNYIGRIKALASETGLTVFPYLPGQRGPKEADLLLKRFGHKWLGGEGEW